MRLTSLSSPRYYEWGIVVTQIEFCWRLSREEVCSAREQWRIKDRMGVGSRFPRTKDLFVLTSLSMRFTTALLLARVLAIDIYYSPQLFILVYIFGRAILVWKHRQISSDNYYLFSICLQLKEWNRLISFSSRLTGNFSFTMKT